MKKNTVPKLTAIIMAVFAFLMEFIVIEAGVSQWDGPRHHYVNFELGFMDFSGIDLISIPYYLMHLVPLILIIELCVLNKKGKNLLVSSSVMLVAVVMNFAEAIRAETKAALSDYTGFSWIEAVKNAVLLVTAVLIFAAAVRLKKGNVNLLIYSSSACAIVNIIAVVIYIVAVSDVVHVSFYMLIALMLAAYFFAGLYLREDSD